MRATWVLTVVSLTTSSARDLGVGEPARDQLEDLELARGQLVEAGRRLGDRGRDLGELLDQAARDRGRQQRLAARHDADALGELLGRDVLEQEAAGARAQRLVDVLVEVEGGQHDHPHRRVVVARGDDAAGRLDAVELGHADVHQHDVGLQPARHVDRLHAVDGLADHLDVVLGVEDHLEAGADERLVVGDHDAHAHAVASSGSRGRGGGQRRLDLALQRQPCARPRSRRRAAGRRAARRRSRARARACRRARGRRSRRAASARRRRASATVSAQLVARRSRTRTSAWPPPCLSALVSASCTTR